MQVQHTNIPQCERTCFGLFSSLLHTSHLQSKMVSSCVCVSEVTESSSNAPYSVAKSKESHGAGTVDASQMSHRS